jgi:hypothetical protein
MRLKLEKQERRIAHEDAGQAVPGKARRYAGRAMPQVI